MDSIPPNPSTSRGILETTYTGLGHLFRDFPVGFNDNDELKAELGIDALRRELRFIGSFLSMITVVALIAACQLKFWPVLIAATLLYALYRVLGALLQTSRETLTPADRARVVEFLDQIATPQYLQPHREVSKQVKKDLRDYSAAVDENFTYDSLDRLIGILSRTLRFETDMFRCAFNVNRAHEGASKRALLKRLIEVLK